MTSLPKQCISGGAGPPAGVGLTSGQDAALGTNAVEVCLGGGGSKDAMGFSEAAPDRCAGESQAGKKGP